MTTACWSRSIRRGRRQACPPSLPARGMRMRIPRFFVVERRALTRIEPMSGRIRIPRPRSGRKITDRTGGVLFSHVH